MARSPDHAYATLLMTDNYLPGAMVLGHSLKDCGTTKQLIALVTSETVSAATIDELRKVYDQVVFIERIRNAVPANLYLMGREDLISTFSKIALWSLTQFRRLVYIDADVVALRAPDELFDLRSNFAAAPDTGWPDIFNSGVMALTPNHQDFHALQSLASSGVSFDGADQGLLNMHFSHNSWERLSFTYNCTPSGNYQYAPAYRHFGSQISLIHFIGRQKPWQTGRNASGFGGVYRELTARWWAVYDKHYGFPNPAASPTPSPAPASSPAPTYTHDQPPPPTQHIQAQPYNHSHSQPQQHVQARSHTQGHHQPYFQAHTPANTQTPTTAPNQTPAGHIHAPGGDNSYHSSFHSAPPAEVQQQSTVVQSYVHDNTIPMLIVSPPEQLVPQHPQPERRFSIPHAEWNPAREPPPAQSRPEASNFPTNTYEMSIDTQLYNPPVSYPEPPRDMYYEVPKEKPRVSEPPKAIFPWESRQPPASRVFPEAPPLPPVPDPDHQPEPMPTLDTSGAETSSEQATASEANPIPPSIATTGMDEAAFNSYSRVNAWDLIPGIQKYVEAWETRRKPKHSPASSLSSIASHKKDSDRRPSLILTDFPTEIERPSLPVTPAPIRAGTTFWGVEKSAESLPDAEGVPPPSVWDPFAGLEELQRKQSQAFLAGPNLSTSLPSREQIASAVEGTILEDIETPQAESEGAFLPYRALDISSSASEGGHISHLIAPKPLAFSELALLADPPTLEEEPDIAQIESEAYSTSDQTPTTLVADLIEGLENAQLNPRLPESAPDVHPNRKTQTGTSKVVLPEERILPQLSVAGEDHETPKANPTVLPLLDESSNTIVEPLEEDQHSVDNSPNNGSLFEEVSSKGSITSEKSPEIQKQVIGMSHLQEQSLNTIPAPADNRPAIMSSDANALKAVEPPPIIEDTNDHISTELTDDLNHLDIKGNLIQQPSTDGSVDQAIKSNLNGSIRKTGAG